jgi:hypothetical protein
MLSRQIVKLSATAKVTHSRYGKSKPAAPGYIRQKKKDVASIAIHNRQISANAITGLCRPKNIHVHAALSIS